MAANTSRTHTLAIESSSVNSFLTRLPNAAVNIYEQSPTTRDILTYELPDTSAELFKQIQTNPQIFVEELPDPNVELFGAIVDKNLSLTTFHHFADLPRELRLQIWRLLLPAPRSVNIRYKVEITEGDLKNDDSTTPQLALPITLHINRESREETYRSCTFNFPPGKPSSYPQFKHDPPRTGEFSRRALFINHTQDMVHLDGLWYFPEFHETPTSEEWVTFEYNQHPWMCTVEDESGIEMFAKVKTLHIFNIAAPVIGIGLLNYDVDTIRSFPIFKTLSHFRGLRRLIITFTTLRTVNSRILRAEYKLFFGRMLRILEGDFKVGRIVLVSGGKLKDDKVIEHGMRIAGLLKGRPSQVESDSREGEFLV